MSDEVAAGWDVLEIGTATRVEPVDALPYLHTALLHLTYDFYKLLKSLKSPLRKKACFKSRKNCC